MASFKCDSLSFIHLSPTDDYLKLEHTGLAVHSTEYKYFWQPFACKIKHKSMTTWIDEIKIRHLVIFGDSLLRDYYCLLLYTGLGGEIIPECVFSADAVYHFT